MAQTLVLHLFGKLDVEVVKGFIVPRHETSKRVAEKLGFRNTGLVDNPYFEEKVHEYEGDQA